MMQTAEAAKIIQTAQCRNPKMEITGVLSYGGGMFLQWLEGPHHSVHELMARIRKDPRHDCVLPLHSMSGLQERLYPEWSMELVPPAEIKKVLRELGETTKQAKHAEAIMLMLQLFDDGPLVSLSVQSE